MTDAERDGDWFAGPVVAWAAPLLATLDARLAAISGLAPDEREVVARATREALLASLRLKLNRVFLLELRAASLAGHLAGLDERQRWDDFLDRASTPTFRERLEVRYPGLGERVTATGLFQIEAAVELAARLVADRAALPAVLGAPPGRLRALRLGAGDTHRGGRSVAALEMDGGPLMYKPRPMEVDAALRGLLDRVPGAAGEGSGDRGGEDGPRLPRVLVRGGYGWTEHVAHHYCRDDAELAQFYRNIGRWLAVMRLVGGTDLHAENIIAHGPVPVVVDAESLFAPDPAPPEPSGRGAAVDIAAATIRRTVLSTGILPVRLGGFALAGVDMSAAGALPGQQPRVPMPVIVGGGSDRAHMEIAMADLPPALNHPCPEPVLQRYWDQVLVGFRDWTDRLRRLDRGSRLENVLRVFDGAEVRRIRRATQSYVEVGRMLWHPASLHDPAQALERGRDILRRNALAVPGAPLERPVIDGEIADLMTGDIPVFTATVDHGTVCDAVRDWRAGDFALEEMTIQGALVGAYLNERALPPRRPAPPVEPVHEDFETRRRAVAAAGARTLCEGAVRAEDGTATWVSPVMTDTGWTIKPLTADVYTGQGGVVLALAGYASEVRRGAADPVEGLGEVLSGALRVLAATEDIETTKPVGGFTGLASQVWTWIALHDLLGAGWTLARARRRAAALTPEVIAGDKALDVLGGAAGVVVPLLNLAAATREDRWLETAALAGRRLERTALLDERGARWSTTMFPEGIGGFAHGATGMGWALHRLALSPAGTVADRARWRELADRALAFEDTLYRPEAANWFDARVGGETDFPNAWCHGSTGIGLAACDLYRRTGEERHLTTARRAGAAGLAEGFGFSHTLCHGDLGLWELQTTLRGLGVEEGVPEARWLNSRLLTDLEERGPVGGLAREAFSPGLMPGLSGVVHQLLRMRPRHRLPSPLLLERKI